MARPRWRFWAWPKELRRRGILGINGRNAAYVLPNNPRASYPQVDNKLLTKRVCEARGIRVPQTYAVIARNGDIRRLVELLGDHQEFVIKPGAGSEGRGIIVIVSHDGADFFTAGAQQYSLADLQYHLAAILFGLYSLGGQPDQIIIEQRIVQHPVFARIAVGGTPDIRIILYRGVPVMAMVRLPTRQSHGRANLHQGAVAAGVHLLRGRTFGGVCKNQAVVVHPDTAQSVEGLEIPGWDGLLAGAMNLADGLALGYLGVDFVLDVNVGPVILEAIPRPGLAIQVANRCGLVPRLAFIDAQPPEMLQPHRRLELVARLAEMA